MKINKNDIKSLNYSEYNPRKISEKQYNDLKKSIIEFGIVDPIIINKAPERNNIVIGGHQRLKICKELGYVDIDCVELDLDIKKEKELNIRLNKSGGEFDFHELIKNFSKKEAVEFGFDLKEIEKGLSNEAFQNRNKEIDEKGYKQENLDRLLEKWKVKEGDLWQVGEHKLICGDSLKEETYEKLLGNEKCQIIFTDPPYGVEYNNGEFQTIKNDDLKEKDLYNFLNQFLKLSVEKLNDTGSVYIWHATRTRRQFEYAIENNGLEEISYIIWVKNSIVVTSAYHYKFQHEPCFFLRKKDKVNDWYGNTEESMIWELNNIEENGEIKSINLGNGICIKEKEKDPIYLTRTKPNKKIREVELTNKLLILNDNTNDVWYVKRDPPTSYLHPTQKPVDLAIRAINNSTRILELVLDPFAGSGFTLLGCESINRRARCIELDPGYCAVILERYYDMTGIKGIKI